MWDSDDVTFLHTPLFFVIYRPTMIMYGVDNIRDLFGTKARPGKRKLGHFLRSRAR